MTTKTNAPAVTGAPQTAYDRIISALETVGRQVKATGDKAKAQCPAHDDNNPSLWITRGAEQALVHCYAGCRTIDVMAALDMRLADLYDNPKQPGRYEYRTLDGAVNRLVCRGPNKKFSQRNGQGRTSLKGVPSILYRLPEVAKAVTAGETIYLCEGEKDANNLHTLTGVCATTAPMGASNFAKVDAAPLNGANVIAIVDRDQAGDKWALDVNRVVGPIAKTLRFVQSATTNEHDDASDHLAAGKSLDELQQVQHLQQGDDVDAYLSGVRNGTWLDGQEFPPLTWAVDGIIPEGYGVLVGAPKIGKSWLALGLLLEIASGGLALGAIPIHPKPVFYLAFEDGNRRMKSRCGQLLGSAVATPQQFQFHTEPTDRVVEVMDRWLDQNPNGVIAVDTLGKIEALAFPAFSGEGAYAHDYRIGSTLKLVADKHPGSTVLVVHHDNKASHGDWMQATSGTNGINGAADWTLLLTRPRGETEGLIRVTGRDVMEGEYAVRCTDGAWLLDGDNLDAAANAAKERVQIDGLGDRSREIVEYVNDVTSGGVTAKQVDDHFGTSDARTYLARLADAGRIARIARGKYGPNPLMQALQVLQAWP